MAVIWLYGTEFGPHGLGTARASDVDGGDMEEEQVSMPRCWVTKIWESKRKGFREASSEAVPPNKQACVQNEG